MQKKRWHETEIEQLIHLYHQGFSAKQISKKLGRSLAGVNKTLCRYGLRLKKRTTQSLGSQYVYPLLKVFPFAHHPLTKQENRDISYLGRLINGQQQSLLPRRAQLDKTTAHNEEPKSDFDTTCPLTWVNRHTNYTVQRYKHPQFKQPIYCIRSPQQEKKFVTYEAILAFANKQRQKLGGKSKNKKESTCPPMRCME